MKLLEIIRCTDLSSEINIERLFDLFISRRTIITDELNIIVCGQIKDIALRQYYIKRVQDVKIKIKGLPIKNSQRGQPVKINKKKNNKDFYLDRGGIVSDGPLRKMRSLKLQETSENSNDEKYEYGLSDW